MARRILNVFLGENLIGQLEQDASGSTRFEYSEAWLNLPQAVPLSASLPLNPGKFHRNRTRPFFAGLLPEEQIRRVVAMIMYLPEYPYAGGVITGVILMPVV